MSILPPVGWDDQAEPVQPQPMTADELNAIRERSAPPHILTVKISREAVADRRALLAEVDRLRAEVERLYNVEFIHNGCQMIRESDNRYLLGELDKAQAKLGLAAELWDDMPPDSRKHMPNRIRAGLDVVLPQAPPDTP